MRRYPALALALLLAASAWAQLAPTSPAQQRAANRRALREARATEAAYKDSHLAVTPQQLKRGASGAPPPTAGEPRFDRDGTPRATGPRFPGLRRKAKTEPSQ